MPFDWKTPIGYLFICLFQSFLFFCVCTNGSNIMNFIIGVCLMSILIIEDIKSDFDVQTISGNTNKDKMKLKKGLYDAVQFHSNVKQFSKLSILTNFANNRRTFFLFSLG